MPRANYLERETAVRAYLDGTGELRYRIPRYYGDKPDFGDMDVIVASRPDWDQLRERIARDLGITDVKIAGRVFSTAFRGLQTDFFAVPEEHLDSTADFMSFNDLGNLIGRICRRFNLKWGETGLSYVYRRSAGQSAEGGDRTVTGNYKMDLPITRDFAPVCAFLGLDHAAWVAGFPTLVSLYEWVVQSPYFSVAPYLDDRGGPIVKRMQDRPTIAQFVEFLRQRRIDARPSFEDRPRYLTAICSAFPDARLEVQLERERNKEARAVEAAAKFNGKLVMQLRPELTGRELGEFIVAFKRSVGDVEAFQAFVVSTPQAQIEDRIRAFTPGPR